NEQLGPPGEGKECQAEVCYCEARLDLDCGPELLLRFVVALLAPVAQCEVVVRRGIIGVLFDPSLQLGDLHRHLDALRGTVCRQSRHEQDGDKGGHSNPKIAHFIASSRWPASTICSWNLLGAIAMNLLYAAFASSVCSSFWATDPNM